MFQEHNLRGKLLAEIRLNVRKIRKIQSSLVGEKITDSSLITNRFDSIPTVSHLVLKNLEKAAISPLFLTIVFLIAIPSFPITMRQEHSLALLTDVC